jgi:hypothetical protein
MRRESAARWKTLSGNRNLGTDGNTQRGNRIRPVRLGSREKPPRPQLDQEQTPKTRRSSELGGDSDEDGRQHRGKTKTATAYHMQEQIRSGAVKETVTGIGRWAENRREKSNRCTRTLAQQGCSDPAKHKTKRANGTTWTENNFH